MAVYVNRFQITNYGDLVRIEFQDQVSPSQLPTIASTVIMRGSDVDALVDKIKELRLQGELQHQQGKSN